MFVGRRRLDLMVEFITALEANPDEVSAATNEVWKSIVSNGKIVVQIAANVKETKEASGDLVAPWKNYFSSPSSTPMSFR